MTSRKNDVKYHEILKQASISVYPKGANKIPAGYRVIDKAENKKNGFYAEAMTNGKDIIVVYRGTERTLNDLKSDIAMAHSDIPAQATDAINFHDKVKRENPDMEVSVTGHSLGGSLAEIVSGIRGTLAVTFNAYGVKDMFKAGTKLKEGNIVNYVNEQDGITMVNGENHIGEIYSVPNLGQTFLQRHFLEGMGNLSERQPITPEELKKTKERIHPTIIKYKNQIDHLVETRNIMRNHRKSTNSSECIGSYSVRNYTRSDGTEVGGYTRTCGAKHNN